MVGRLSSRAVRVVSALLLVLSVSACVSTEALYAEYDAADCNLVATKDATGALNLHEQNTDTHYPWEPAVYFATDSSELVAEERARLDRSMQVMQAFPALSVGLQGFTDRTASHTYNYKLAERRVRAVKAYMESKGIDSNRVVLQPIGEMLPQISADTDKAMTVNRRVELMLLNNDGRPTPVLYAKN